MAQKGTDVTSPTLDRERTREAFEGSTDFTVGLEEEFALLDPHTLELVHRFEELYDACQADERAGGLGRGRADRLRDRDPLGARRAASRTPSKRKRSHRNRLFGLAGEMGIALGAMGTHPWANYLDQRIIDTEHYNRLRAELRWVAQRNNTWSLHVHMGVQGADRAIAVCDHLRGVLPQLLAASANSPFLDRRDSGLASVRSEIFTRTFPRCGVHEPFGDYETYADFIDTLTATNSVVESTQLWWSVRPHHTFGTVEFRICDAQTSGADSFALAGLIAACIAQAAVDHSEGVLRGPAAPARDRGEPVAGDPLGHGREDDRLGHAARRSRRPRQSRRCSTGRPQCASSSASTPTCPAATAPSGRARRSRAVPRSRRSTPPPSTRPAGPMPRTRSRRPPNRLRAR